MMKYNKKLMLFLIATFVTFFGIGYTLIKGTQAIDTDDVETISVSNYSELSNAIERVNATTDKYKIVLNSDIELETFIQIGEENGEIVPNVIIDLQTYYLTSKQFEYTVEGVGTYFAEYGLKNYGNLELVATTGGITTSSTDEDTLSDIVLVNYNKMVINGGNYLDGATVGSAQVLVNHGELEINSGTFTKNKNGGVMFSNIEGGTFTFNGGKFVFDDGIFENNGTMIMNNGEIFSGSDYGIRNFSELEINNGSITSNTTCINNGKITSSEYEENTNLVINGGNFNVTTVENTGTGTPTYKVIANCGNVEINGGSYSIKNEYDNIRVSFTENYGYQTINDGEFVGESSYGTGYLYGIRNLNSTSSTTVNGGLFKLKQDDLSSLYESKFFSGNTEYKENLQLVMMIVDEYKIAKLDSESNYFNDGDGSEDNPYQITTVDQLNAIRYFPTKNYILMNDLDLEDDTLSEEGNYYNGGLGWDPIGSYTTDVRFSGIFDGNYHTILGLNIDREEDEYVGLFARVTGTVKNVAIIDSSIQGKQYVGSVVGYSWGTLNNIYVNNNVYGESIVGGVAGHAENISNSYNLGNIFAKKSVGGIAGQANNITYCYNAGIIDGTENANSLVGYVYTILTSNTLQNYKFSLIGSDNVVKTYELNDLNSVESELIENWDIENIWEVLTIDGILRFPRLKEFNFKHVSAIEIYDTSTNLKVGDSILYNVTPNSFYNTNLLFVSSNEDIVSLTENGTIETLNDGETTIRMYSLYDGYVKDISVIVENNELMFEKKNDDYSLEFDTELVIDEENKYIKYITVDTKISELLENVNVTGSDTKVLVYDASNEEKNSDDVLASGDILVVYVGEAIKDKYTISVSGDANGDGEINLIDLVQMRKHIVEWVNPNTNEIQVKTGVYYYAIDMNQDNKIDLIDLVRIRKTIVGLI